VAHYFASDVHLRFDRPDRDRRFRAFLSGVNPGDTLVIAGDLCDFWMAARFTQRELLRSESLQGLAEFRHQGGELLIMPGNHDAWLCPFYQSALGAQIIGEPLDFLIHGLRLRLAHGHRLGARRAWKAGMESRAFFEAFRRVPASLAVLLDQVLCWSNERRLAADEERHLRVFRKYAETCRGEADLVVVGHVHRAVDDGRSDPRLIVLGGWQSRSSYLRVDPAGASFHIEEDTPASPPTAALARHPSGAAEAELHED
jgi:UDP-2,3-diacylglucosamine hydrolase